MKTQKAENESIKQGFEVEFEELGENSFEYAEHRPIEVGYWLWTI
jgi:hypothetical protein